LPFWDQAAKPPEQKKNPTFGLLRPGHSILSPGIGVFMLLPPEEAGFRTVRIPEKGARNQ
jgi:hypothetical protein